MNVDAMIAAALRRVCKGIERRYQIAMGRPRSTANRSVGQMFKRKGSKA